RGAQLDVLARADMWRYGAAYLHGTGHGVGHCLNVHEGPQSIRLQENPVQLMPGMVTSDEPGIYRAGEYGIRCENLLLCVEAFTSDMGEFLKFETLTLYPFDMTLVDPDMLDRWEIEWLNNYQKRVYSQLAPLLDSDDKRKWLADRCATI
ncbi:MAG: M24 family metallopeptidase C-terminal domain-containing protein, partial [Paramuribaculum sp.]|nr:M24 family metallopeptidase C-terminal domain-containing protein [Paramuribaculum sp.]